MKNVLLIAGMSLILTSCATSTPEEKSNQRVILNELKLQQNKYLSVCIRNYKSTMHNPNTFSLAGGGRILYVKKGAFLNTSNVDQIMWLMRIRGSNAYGGIVLQCMYCVYDYKDGDMIYKLVMSQKFCVRGSS